MEIISNVNKNNIDLNRTVIKNWEPPIEGFVSDPEFAEPVSCNINETNYIISDLDKFDPQLSQDEIILVHETDKQSARDIVENGFKIKSNQPENIRENAVFGWLCLKDIGNHIRDVKEDAQSVILFKAKKENVYVSSYGSAKKLYLGSLNYNSYLRNHTVKYNEFKSLIWNGELESMGYNPSDLIVSNNL